MRRRVEFVGMTGIRDARDREAVTVLEVGVEIHAVARLRKVLALHRQNPQMLAERACPHALFMHLAERVQKQSMRASMLCLCTSPNGYICPSLITRGPPEI